MGCQKMVWRERAYLKEVRFARSVCAKAVGLHLRVSYSGDMHSTHRPHRPVATEDVFGLCKEHGMALLDVEKWKNDARHPMADPHTGSVPSVRGLRGHVAAVVADGTCPSPEDATRSRVKDEYRSQIHKLLRLKGARTLTVEDWREVFDTCLEEWTVESVLRS